MKRSEMIKLLANDIDCIRKTGWQEASNETLAMILLKHVEETGMKPPDCNYHNSEYGVWDFWEEEK